MPLHLFFADDIRALRQGTAAFAAGSERERTARLADRAARSPLPILIETEAGSGAKALARAIHEAGERKVRPFAVFQAGETLSGTETQAAALLRHMREAQGGTLLIEGVEHLTDEAQGRLMDGLFRQEASTRPGRRLDIRLIASAGFDLSDRVREGRFKEDLYYRLQAMPIALRPLRAQRQAVSEWAMLFAERFAKDEGKKVRGFSADAMSLLARYDWPGNLRQLENAIYRAVILADGAFLTPSEFPQIAAHVDGYHIDIPPVPAVWNPAPVRMHETPDNADPHALSLIRESGDMLTLAELEERAIRFALVHYQGHLSAISRHLGIGRSTLYRKLKELGLSDAAA
ncbi:sigma 54-interacting transcriptional regulator [Microvirga sp. ACRRW]|uniref:sigma-54-dependent transcriptional regulator n=1 Tax=Microvirga sp. ACRRW TaxID=2918205 RepID=UPI001EF50D47|nr:sigma 54-interacting transcriptional regulator [Microvirga sp. ACRRW]MCG7394368.1 sigma 54-interacting transcriptional regulator [Microvirga sp. ACRRW]